MGGAASAVQAIQLEQAFELGRLQHGLAVVSHHRAHDALVAVENVALLLFVALDHEAAGAPPPRPPRARAPPSRVPPAPRVGAPSDEAACAERWNRNRSKPRLPQGRGNRAGSIILQQALDVIELELRPPALP